MTQLLRLHNYVAHSRANGPGERAVIWVQGCSLGCPGCFNEPTHEANTGELISVDALFERITALGSTIEGVTISGGEPLQQKEGVAALLRRVKAETNLSTVVFSGFSWEEIEKMRKKEQATSNQPTSAENSYPLALLHDVDVLIAGRYVQQLRIARDLRGSSNKKLHFLTDRYTAADFATVPEAEIVITPDGEVILSGIEPLKW